MKMTVIPHMLEEQCVMKLPTKKLRGPRWWCRLMERLYDYLRVRVSIGVVSYVSVHLDTGNLIRTIEEQLHNFIMIRGTTPKYLLLGGNHYQEFMSSSMHSCIKFDVMEGRYYGMTILLVPWMDGWTVLENLDDMRLVRL